MVPYCNETNILYKIYNDTKCELLDYTQVPVLCNCEKNSNTSYCELTTILNCTAKQTQNIFIKDVKSVNINNGYKRRKKFFDKIFHKL